jgi:glycosyltransferase involved in cell wall biosynthesis
VSGAHHIHVPVPGDHYSAATGSAIMTIIYEVSRPHVARGGRSTVMVSQGTRHDYPVGECVEVQGAMRLPPRREVAFDAACGRVGLPRFRTDSAYRAACDGVPATGDWVFSWNAPVPLGRLARTRPGIRRCLWMENELFRTYSDTELRRYLSHADRVIGCSQFIADRVAERAGNQSSKVHSILNGVDAEAFTPPPGPPPSDEPVILFVGRLVPEKGAHLLLEAVRAIAGPSRPFRVQIVGSAGFTRADPLSAYEKDLRRLASPLGQRVEFIAFLDRAAIVDVYRGASIQCVPSNWDEPFGLTTLEGMASGLAVVGSRRGGIPEAGGSAIEYFDPTDPSTLADVLAWLIDDQTARADLGRRGRARAEELSWENQYEKLLATLED